ncbi:RTA-like protein [Hypomontagnella monticulosa]|nr:RTA-like protein [Hypomontagnella monticulosa]
MARGPWAYQPSAAAAMIFMILFLIATAWHLVVVFRRRVWYFIVLVVGGCIEVAGYLARFLATNDTSSLGLFVVQTLCILVAPALIAASIYMVLGRLILLLRAEEYSPIRPSLLTKIFVGGDLLSFLVQVMGSGMLSSNFTLGKAIILAGLAAQILFFAVFVAVMAVFHRRMARKPTATSMEVDRLHTRMGWVKIVRVMYVASAMIFIRSVFRFCEFTGSEDSPLMTSEAYLYVCDSTLMFGVLAVLLYCHPAEYVPNRKQIRQMLDEELS